MMRYFFLVAVVWSGVILPSPSSADDEVFERPVRLEADGEVIDSGKEAWAHSGPCVEDLDGDGLPDLIVGDFSGTFRVYKNVGKPHAPVYHDTGKLQAGGEDAKVRIYCCIASQPRFLDLDGDGLRDFISNSYDPGHCYFFRGQGNHEFAAREELLDKAGVPLRSAPRQQQDYQSFGSFFTPVDWDADGDLDVLIGCFDGDLKLRINEGDAKEHAFAEDNVDVLAAGQPLKVQRHCCPVAADWDADGLWDLICSAEDGSVTWWRNVGDRQHPRFEEARVLVAKAPGDGFGALRWTEDDVVPGMRVQIDVVDYNGDGKLDLLVGDFSSVYEPRKDLDEQQKKQLQDLIAAAGDMIKPFVEKRKALQKEFDERYPGDAIFSDEADAAWSKAYQALRESPEAKAMEVGQEALEKQIRPLLARTRGEEFFRLEVVHGYVWLFLRK